MGCGAEREILCCPATVGATKAAGKPLLNGFANLDFLIRLQPKTCPEQSRRIENLKSEIIGWEGAGLGLKLEPGDLSDCLNMPLSWVKEVFDEGPFAFSVFILALADGSARRRSA